LAAKFQLTILISARNGSAIGFSCHDARGHMPRGALIRS
jgi:hypothetical protein